MSETKNDGPVTDDDNFVNVDPDFANYSNEVDRPLPLPDVEDYNVPEEFREEKKDEDADEKKEQAKEAPKVPTSPATPPAASTASK